MSKGVKIILAVVAACLVVGVVAIVVSVITFSVVKSNSAQLKTAFTADADIESFSIDVGSSDVEFIRTDKKKAYVECIDDGICDYEIRTNNATLIVTQLTESEDTSAYSDNHPEVKIYIPKKEYYELRFDSTSGDLKIGRNIKIKSIRAYSDSGDVDVEASASGSLLAKTSAGDVELSIGDFGDIQIETDSGEINCEEIKGKSISLLTESGEISLDNAAFFGNADIETDSGDIELDNVKSQNSSVKSNTGKIKGKINNN